MRRQPAEVYVFIRASSRRCENEGVETDREERWNATVAASVAVTAMHPSVAQAHVDYLRAAGLDELEIADGSGV
ncbi:hypothetical protein ILFOPFJJ_05368 [Ensifer psoraleae]|uniref:hypothetical protein n=1 Tax=Sinorhizobium psoraleae TaxID=520838 RepID=UPI00156863E3|nr:hypothetical protein [Sinorhizobium psoraleae]NRP74446.1 hypothetical protein [Sinorhizobium psoraleae]